MEHSHLGHVVSVVRLTHQHLHNLVVTATGDANPELSCRVSAAAPQPRIPEGVNRLVCLVWIVSAVHLLAARCAGSNLDAVCTNEFHAVQIPSETAVGATCPNLPREWPCHPRFLPHVP